MDHSHTNEKNQNSDVANLFSLNESQSRIQELIKTYPEIWSKVKTAVPGLFQNFNPEALALHVTKLKQTESYLMKNISAKNLKTTERQQAAKKYIETKLTLYYIHASLYSLVSKTPSPQPTGWDEKIAQRFFFTRSFERKAVSAIWFPLFWKMVKNKQVVIHALKVRGIYCVFSKQFGIALSKIIGKRSCIEVGAGDGTLTLLLEKYGVYVHATDDQSWRHVIRYPDWVENLDAQTSLKKYNPEIVLCSWPPPGNSFEQEIFRHPTVKPYIVIGTKHEFGSGNRDTYKQAIDFSFKKDEQLSRLIFPHEIGHEVLVFKRK